MTVQEQQDALIQTFYGFKDWMETYEYLIEQGRMLNAMDASLKTQENALTGCQSSVWITAETSNGTTYFYADSDALITRGLISMLFKVLNGRSPEEIVHANLYFIERTGLGSHLSPSRATGLQAIVKRMKNLAKEGSNTKRCRQSIQ